MGLAIPIETSARHIHLCREDFEILFGEGKELTFKSELSQPGQFACEERLEVRGPKGAFERVAVLGPFRGETQVEISMTDSRKLGIPGMIRQSGDTAGTPGCTLVGPCGSVELDHGVIVAKRHIHMTPVQAYQLNVKDNDSVFVITQSFERALIFADVIVRVSPQSALCNARRYRRGKCIRRNREPDRTLPGFSRKNPKNYKDGQMVSRVVAHRI